MAAIIGRQALAAAPQILAAGKQVGMETFGYDFIGLLVKVVFFQIAALLIAKYIEAVIGTSNIILAIVRFLGFSIPQFLPQSVVDFYTNGWNGIKYWDVVKLATVLIIAVEMNQYITAQKRSGGSPSAATVAVFILLIGFFLIITLPELVQRIKDANAMTQTTSTTEGATTL